MKKRIIYLRTDICSDPLVVGGSVGHTMGLINNFSSYVVTVYSSSMWMLLRKQKNISFTTLNVWPLFIFFRWKFNYLRWRLESFFSSFFFFFQILPIFKKHTFAFIYQRYSILNLTGVLISKYKKIPLILEYNGSEAYWFDISLEDVWYRRWFAFKRLSYWIENLNLKHADAIIAVSQALKDDLVLRNIEQNKILVNPNGVEEQIFSGAQLMEKRIRIREKYNLVDSFVFGFIGTFGHWHGIPMLEKIIPLVCKKHSKAKFLLIGDGALKTSLEQSLKKYIESGQVILTGKIDQHLAPEYLSACDAYLCPTAPNQDGSRFFGSPTKLFEYMSMAKPVIASDLEQLSDILAPAIKVDEEFFIKDQIGILVSPLDENEFVKACELCLHMSKEEHLKLGDNARAKILAKYTWKKHVERIMEHIEFFE